MSKRRGHPIMAAVFGFLAGLFGAASLAAFGVIPVDSVLITALPLVLMVLAFALAMWAPIGRSKQAAPARPTAHAEAPPPAVETAPPAADDAPPPAGDDAPPPPEDEGAPPPPPGM